MFTPIGGNQVSGISGDVRNFVHYFWQLLKHLSIIDFVFVPHVFYLKVSSSIFLIIRLFIVFLTQKKEEGWGGGGCLQFWYLLLPHWVLIRILSDNFCAFALDALLIIGLPDGPTAHFKLSKLVLRKDIKVCCFCVLNFFSFFSLSHLLNLLLLS